MSQGRIKLLVAGIISLLLLSSFSVWRIFRDKKRIETKIETYIQTNNSREAIRNLIKLVSESDHLTSSWIFLPDDLDAKARLKQLQSTGYPALKKNISLTMEGWHTTLRKRMQSVLIEVDTLISRQQRIESSLVYFTDYQDEKNMAASKAILWKQVMIPEKTILSELTFLSEDLDKSAADAWTLSLAEIENADEVSLLLSILMFISGILGLIIVLSKRRT